MANYGKNFPYGKSYYKDYGVILTTVEISPKSVALNNGQQQQFSWNIRIGQILSQEMVIWRIFVPRTLLFV